MKEFTEFSCPDEVLQMPTFEVPEPIVFDQLKRMVYYSTDLKYRLNLVLWEMCRKSALHRFAQLVDYGKLNQAFQLAKRMAERGDDRIGDLREIVVKKQEFEDITGGQREPLYELAFRNQAKRIFLGV